MDRIKVRDAKKFGYTPPEVVDKINEIVDWVNENTDPTEPINKPDEMAGGMLEDK